ncbi:MAG: hypothetical protein EOP45_08040 [Sphingobacteriaceae bacterium]|nr:MAG: hypothetical protein EOP45_08040 [Sphingobacteriaceae bacterium]
MLNQVIALPDFWLQFKNSPYQEFRSALRTLVSSKEQREHYNQQYCQSRFQQETNIPVDLENAVVQYQQLHINVGIWEIAFFDRNDEYIRTSFPAEFQGSWFQMKRYITAQWHEQNRRQASRRRGPSIKQARRPEVKLCQVRQLIGTERSPKVYRVWHFSEEDLVNFVIEPETSIQWVNPFIENAIRAEPLRLKNLPNGTIITTKIAQELYHL